MHIQELLVGRAITSKAAHGGGRAMGQQCQRSQREMMVMD